MPNGLTAGEADNIVRQRYTITVQHTSQRAGDEPFALPTEVITVLTDHLPAKDVALIRGEAAWKNVLVSVSTYSRAQLDMGQVLLPERRRCSVLLISSHCT